MVYYMYITNKELYMSYQAKVLEFAKELKKQPYHSPSLSTGGNAKLVTDSIAYFSLPAGLTCPGADTCNSQAFCYAQNGNYIRMNVIKKQLNNFFASQKDSFVYLMVDRISNLSAKVKFIRIHDSGDFYSKAYIAKWAQIIEDCSMFDVKFYAYTKSYTSLDLSALWNLENMNLIQSEGSKDDSLIDYSKPHARIFPSLEELEAAGYHDSSRSDYPAALGEVKIGLVIHGAGKSRWNG